MKSFEEQLAIANNENIQTTEAVKKLSSAAEIMFSDAKENRSNIDNIKPVSKAETIDKDSITSKMDALGSKEGKGRKDSILALDRLKEIKVEINALDDGELKDALTQQHKILKEGFDKQASLLSVGFDTLKSSFGDLGMTVSGAIGSTSPLAGFMVGMVTNQIKSMLSARKQRKEEKKEAAELLSAQKESKVEILKKDKSPKTNTVQPKSKVGVSSKNTNNPITSLFASFKTVIASIATMLKRFLLIPMLIVAALGLLFVGLNMLIQPFKAEIAAAFDWLAEKFSLVLSDPAEAYEQFKQGSVDSFDYVKGVFSDIFKNIGALLPEWAQSLLGITPNTDGADGAIRTDSVVVDYAFKQGKEAVSSAFGWISDKAATITKDLGFVSNDSPKLKSSDVLIQSNIEEKEAKRKSQAEMFKNSTSVNAVKQSTTNVNNSQSINLMQPNLVHNEPSIMRLTSIQSM